MVVGIEIPIRVQYGRKFPKLLDDLHLANIPLAYDIIVSKETLICILMAT